MTIADRLEIAPRLAEAVAKRRNAVGRLGNGMLVDDCGVEARADVTLPLRTRLTRVQRTAVRPVGAQLLVGGGR